MSGDSTAPPPANGHGAEPHVAAGFGLWFGFTLLIIAALAIDLVMGSRQSMVKSHVQHAAIASAAWLSLGFGFAIFLGICYSSEIGMIFLTGYLVEKSLSVDNLVVILLIFRSFRIPPSLQGRVLKWGILGAIVCRTIFIFAGVALLECFSWTIYGFGLILLYSAYKMWADDDEEEEDPMGCKKDSKIMLLMQKFIPYRDSTVTTACFFEEIGGKLYATPMFAALIVVELSDILFAVDSIPCILGLTHDLFLVFSSNMLAILGLRSLYLLLVEVLDRFKHLKAGLAVILCYVGIKMIWGETFPIPHTYSLLVIFGILAVTLAMGGLTTPHSQKLSLCLPT